MTEPRYPWWGIRPLATLVLATFASACGETATMEVDLTPSVRDSAGVTVVENPHLPAGTGGWRLGPEPSLEVGVLDGASAYQLHQVRGAIRLEDGRVAVLDGGSNELRVYGEDGAHLETWAHQGEGPGEFASAQALTRWQGDSIAVWDLRLRRLTVFGADGPPGRDFVVPPVDGIETLRFPRFEGTLDDGSMVLFSVTAPGLEPVDGPVRIPVRVAVTTPAGELVGDLGDHPGQESYMQVSENAISVWRNPVSRGYVLAPAGAEVVVTSNERYELKLWRRDGSLARIVRVTEPPRIMTDDLRQAEIRHRVDDVPEEAKAGMRRSFEVLPFPDTVPALGHVLADRSGHLWVQPFRLAHDEGPDDWIVLDPEGRAVARVALPGGLNVHEIGDDYVLGHATDDFDVEYVQLWPLHRDP
jgi:hypothetical protein